jgi:hypothetical protein
VSDPDPALSASASGLLLVGIRPSALAAPSPIRHPHPADLRSVPLRFVDNFHLHLHPSHHSPHPLDTRAFDDNDDDNDNTTTIIITATTTTTLDTSLISSHLIYTHYNP